MVDPVELAAGIIPPVNHDLDGTRIDLHGHQGALGPFHALCGGAGFFGRIAAVFRLLAALPKRMFGG